MRNVRDTVRRIDTGVVEAQNYGVTLTHTYWTVGPYDMISILEAPDDESATAYLLEVCSPGNIRTTTLRAYDREEMSGILQRFD
jgi:uncharacterized protein with GYD domain